jgi:small subunit ribosomal protein S6
MGNIPASGRMPEAISPKGGVMIMRSYEAMYIIRPKYEDEQCAAIIEKFNAIIQANGGEVVKTDAMGRKKLAYEIEKVREGYYVLVTFNAPADLPAELERNFRISDEVMRYLVVKLPE